MCFNPLLSKAHHPVIRIPSDWAPGKLAARRVCLGSAAPTHRTETSVMLRAQGCAVTGQAVQDLEETSKAKNNL